jgi:hypothetical protein
MQKRRSASLLRNSTLARIHLIQKTERPRQNSLACFPRFRIPRFSACRRFHRWSFAWSSFQRVRRTSVLRKLDHANYHRRLSRALKRRAWVFKTEQQFHIGAMEVCEEYDDIQSPSRGIHHKWRIILVRFSSIKSKDLNDSANCTMFS